jgi:hypothetical protein
VPEGLSPGEVGKEIAEHRKHTAAPDTEHDRHDRWLSIVEALLLSLVAVLAAYSGYAAAKWGTESSVTLAKASAERTKANRADTEGIVTRTLDSASFNAWFTAFTSGNANDQRLAEKRMRPGYRPAFNAWMATDPAHNPNAPPGPAYMPQYVIPQDAAAKAHDARPTPRSPREPRRARPLTSTSARPCSSRPCCSWSGSAAHRLRVAGGVRRLPCLRELRRIA